jgi:hypothetical protein
VRSQGEEGPTMRSLKHTTRVAYDGSAIQNAGSKETKHQAM